MKAVLFTPGFHSEEEYDKFKGRAALELMEQLGYKVVFVPIHWKHRTVDDWAGQLRAAYVKYDPAETILAGFSFGAITSLVVAAERLPAELWLFSLSPFFAEDLKYQKQSYLDRVIGRRRVAAFAQLDFDALTSHIACPTKVLAGSKEMQRYPGIKRRSEAAAKYIRNSTYTVIAGAGHAIESEPYLAAIAANI